MNKYIKSLAVGLLAGGGLLTTSCEIDFKPIDNFSSTTFWGSQAEFEGFITAQSHMFRENYPTNIFFNAGEIRAGSLGITPIDGSGAADVVYIQNVYRAEDNYQFTNFGKYYGFIGNLNELIYRCDNTDVLTDNVKNGLLGIAYGWRAYCYFQMYRMYGGLVLRLDPDVVLGNYDLLTLYKGRSSPKATMQQIKDDIKASLDYFNQSTYVYKSATKDYYWTKAATEMLAGEVYLWSGKVTTEDFDTTRGEDQVATPSDVTIAAEYFDNVIHDYGYELHDDYLGIWTTPHNSESIYSICYTNESDNIYYGHQSNMIWHRRAGAGYNSYWSTMDQEGWNLLNDGTANRFGRWYDPVSQTSSDITLWGQCDFNPMRYCYKNALYYQFDAEDSRIKVFYPMYEVTEQEREDGVVYLTDFDPTDGKHPLVGCYFCKLRPKMISKSTYYTFANDMPIYRLTLAYMYAAECANYLDDNDGVEYYINEVRKRAYGDNWDEDKYGYTAGSFKDNEVAILHEKDKEFVYEGQRWWDLRRLTSVKDGTQKDHLVFCPEGCVGYGLDVANNPWMVENDGSLSETDVPVLNGTTQDEHLLLWPIDSGVINSDVELKEQQNPGY